MPLTNKKFKVSSSLDSLLIKYDKLGIIPGPAEMEPEFLKRAENCLGLRKRIESELGTTIPLRQEELAPAEVFERPLDKTEALWGIRPDWVPVFFSNYRLLPWHGGCAWIFQLKAEDPPMALFQLRRAFAQQETYLGIYDRDELVEHELCHVGRMSFHEPHFEEILAYRSSKSRFRRWFGPLFQSSIETVIFLISLLLVFGVDAYALAFWGPEAYAQVSSLKILPGAMFAFGLGRLFRRQWQFQRCLKRLTAYFNDPKGANRVMYRLTDKEIVSFGARQNVEEYAKGEGSLRWRLLKLVYFH